LNIFEISSILVSISASLMYVNFRFLKLPMTIGLMLLSLIFSFFIFSMGFFVPQIHLFTSSVIGNIDFNITLMGGMLSFLLFAGSLHVDLNDLFEQKVIISILATLGVVFSTLLVGTITYYVLALFGININYIYCLLFGSLISPTDPIAVLGLLKETNSPKSLKTTIAGESLFNDGVGVVVFTVILTILSGGSHISISEISFLFIEEAVGGIVFGLIIGYIFFKLLKSVDNYPLEIMLTLALVMGGYSLASHLHLSGPLAMVVAGLFIGNHGKMFAMSETTHKQLFSFWELIDEFLNALLFVLIGFEVLVISFNFNYLITATLLIPLILLVRYIAITIPLKIMGDKTNLSKGSAVVMTWCGLRGGISIALALSLPESSEKSVIIAITYVVVAFSILVQGLTAKKVVNRMDFSLTNKK